MTRRLTLHMISGMLTLAVVLAAVTGVRSFLKKRAENQNVGGQNALLGARITQHILEKAVDNGLFDDAALFHGHYEPVGGDTTRYHTQYDGFFDRNVVTILKAFQANNDIYYAYVVNNDGYFPAHTDSEKSKTMHADAGPPAAAPPGESYDRLVKSQAGHTFRESRSPILVHGRSWGEFCVGIPEALANVRGRETAVSTFCATMLLSLIVVGAMACLIRRGLRPYEN